MKALLLSPIFPISFWHYSGFLEMSGLKALAPPLGLITAAALLPKDWTLRLHDRNVGYESEDDWAWCDIVMISAMRCQQADYHQLIAKAVRLGKKVAVGGPYVSSNPTASLNSGAHYLVLGEGESTIPQFVKAIERGDPTGIFRCGEWVDLAKCPVPRFDLLKQGAYYQMAVQTNRGCPYSCEFCEIPLLDGHRTRTKGIEQIIAELQAIYALGYRGTIFFTDDNFIISKTHVKDLLRALVRWNDEHGRPFDFLTQASVNVAEDDEMLQLMGQAGFHAVFLGIETPDVDLLKMTKKQHNIRRPLIDACRKINEAGMLIHCGMIIGFDGEKPGAGDRIQSFVEETSIPQAMLAVLQAVPKTPLWNRLEREGRLLLLTDTSKPFLGNDTAAMPNFTPTRPVREIAKEFVEAAWNLYEPSHYLRRCYRQVRRIRVIHPFRQNVRTPFRVAARLMPRLLWRQGILTKGARLQFWLQLAGILLTKPQLLMLYLNMCGAGEHFFNFRQMVRERIVREMGGDLQLSIARQDTGALVCEPR